MFISSQKNTLMKYIREIDGLRGLAVILIILSHFPFLNFQSGGVNIFFVISGYLITGILLKNDSINLKNFYFKRFKSLYPQLFLVSLFIIVIYTFFSDLDDAKYIFRYFITSVIPVINLYLIKIEDVYSIQNNINPFLHLWAFAVIIQFYIFYGIYLKILFFLKEKFKLKKKKLFIILLLSTIFFFIVNYLNNFIHTSWDYSTHFYSPLSRFWQFFCGCSLYFFLSMKITNEFKKTLMILGITIIIFWQFGLFNDYKVTSIFLTLSTVLIIYSTSNKFVLNLMLSSKGLVYFGKLSYPLYLIHIPMIFLFEIFMNNNFIILILSLLSTYILSLFLFRIQNSNFLKITFDLIYERSRIIILTLILIIPFSFTLYIVNLDRFKIFEKNIMNVILKFNNFEKKNIDFVAKYGDSYHEVYSKVKGKYKNDCINNVNPFENCKFISKGSKKNIILTGGSIQSALGFSIKQSSAEMGYNYYQLTNSACFYAPNFQLYFPATKKISNFCNKDFHEKTTKLILDLDNSITVIGAHWSQAFNFDCYQSVKFGMAKCNFPYKYISENNISFKTSLKNSLLELLNKGEKIILIYPLPEIGFNVIRQLKKNLYKDNHLDFTLPFDIYKNRTKEIYAVLDSIEHDNIFRIYPHELFCNNIVSDKCVVKDKDKIFFSDSIHPSLEGSRMINNLIVKKIQEIESISDMQ